jgi:glucosyl-3-phosphoglycerate synthase
MNVDDWFAKNKFKSKSFSNIKRLVEIKKRKKLTISLCLPTYNEEKTVGKIIRILKSRCVEEYPLLDEIVVVDSGSTDNTRKIVEAEGVPFYYADKILKKYGSYKGKGENLWKGLYITKGDIIIYLDTDVRNMHPRFVYGLVGPLLTRNSIWFTKAFYQRPIKVGKELRPLGGGRVTELTIRPLFNMYFPRLSGFIQPLSGEYAGRRKLFEKIPFFTGYGVETAMLIDIQKKFGLKKMAQVDLFKRVHRNQSLVNLSKMSFGILQVFAKRANTLGKLILVDKVRNKVRIIEHKEKDGSYLIKKKRVIEKQRPPIITIKEYRKKFKKNPKWLAL